MHMLKKKIVLFFWTAWFAFGHFWLTVLIFNNFAHRSLIATTALNFALIIVFLIEDRVGNYLNSKQKAKEQGRKQNIFARILKAYLNSVSFKTALYLFHIFILVCTAIDGVEPDFFNYDFSLYLLTVEYGLLVLVAGDAFLHQFLKDVSER